MIISNMDKGMDNPRPNIGPGEYNKELVNTVQCDQQQANGIEQDGCLQQVIVVFREGHRQFRSPAPPSARAA